MCYLDRQERKTNAQHQVWHYWGRRNKPQHLYNYLASVPAGRYKFGLRIKHQQYCNYQLRLSAEGTRIPQQRQAFFVGCYFGKPHNLENEKCICSSTLI
jgi:hypothetical protein